MKAYDFKENEKEILKYWEDKNIYHNIKHKSHGKKKFYFLQGPPYTSGRLHLGQTWNHSLKDMILRYKRMQGFDVWDRGGYDMHGLPTENKVQAKFDLHTKKDIIQFGLDKFSKECLKFSEGNAVIMSEDLWKIGIWMNNENAYMPVKNSFMEGEWFLIKKAHEKNRLYKGKKVMTWCKSCETALAKHELEYKTVKDLSIFVKFKVKNQDNTYLIIWTTTPWTIPFNLAVMVNPELDYLKAKVHVEKGKEETWIVSSALSIALISGVAGKEFKVIEEFKGDKLLGLEYEHPFESDILHYKDLKKNHKNVHTVILSEEFVDTSAGSGLVHCAPGCGPEDFEVGRANGIPAFNEIDELGAFSAEMGRFAGMRAKEHDDYFITVLREKNAIVETAYVEHEYAHCWRCKQPVVFRTTEQWFFKVEDLKDKMVDFNKGINWYPETAKNAFDSWLKNLKDNSITRQRFWGTPVPIWQCENPKCNKYEVIGSIAELKEKSVGNKVPDNLHIPWINAVKLKCSCGHEMKIEGDVLDVWIDAGTTSWNCLDYPNNTELFEKYYPADYIVEGKDQIRGWFNLLMVASTLAFDKPAFKNVGMHGFITDVEGEKMSKSLGNIITPGEVTEKFGADTLRYYVTEITAGDDMNFSWKEIELKYRNLMILWNLHNFVIDFKLNNNIELKKNIKDLKLDAEEKFILSRLHSTMKNVTEALEKYHFDNVTHHLETLYMDLSRTYIQLIREKSVVGSDDEKEAILYTMYEVLLGIIKMFSIICPFITEKMYMNLKEHFELLTKESIHDFDWPKYDSELINADFEKNMVSVQQVMQSILSCRDKMNLGVRWPLSECIVDTSDEEIVKAVESLKELIMQQTNVKLISMRKMDVDLKVKPNLRTLGKDFGNRTAHAIELINENGKRIADAVSKNQSVTIEDFEFTMNHVIVERIVPQGYEMASVIGGAVYLDKKMTPELEIEGFAREVIRRTQQLRKDSGLNKRDVIELLVISELHDLKKHESIIKEKTGSKHVSFASEMKEHHYEHAVKETIKGKEFGIMLKKI